MGVQKTACVIYVASTSAELSSVKRSLEDEGYKVTLLLVSVDVAQHIKDNDGEIPPKIRAYIEQADLCVFLLPEDPAEDSGIQGIGGLAGQIGTRIVGLVAGTRTMYPVEFELAGSMIRVSSPRLRSVIQGENIWEDIDNSPSNRSIDHQRCQ